jgi:hypothetical protein
MESARGEGASPTVELVGLGGGEGQESIGFSGCLTVPGGERLLNRSRFRLPRWQSHSTTALGER